MGTPVGSIVRYSPGDNPGRAVNVVSLCLQQVFYLSALVTDRHPGITGMDLLTCASRFTYTFGMRAQGPHLLSKISTWRMSS